MAGRKQGVRGASPSESAAFAATLEQKKRESTVQILFRVARLLDEEALRRVARRTGAPRLRRSHTALLPHIDLEGTRVSELAERLGVTKQAVSQLLDELEARGVLERVPDPEDARARLVKFTARGRAGLLEGLELLRELEQELAEAVGAQPMEQLRTTLLAIHDRMARYPSGMAETPVRIYHNPRCSKSREALSLLQERGIEPEVVLYLQTELAETELKALVEKLGVPPHAILRTKEAAYAEANLSEKSSLDQVVKAIRSAPILLERPIVVKGEQAVIGRPPEKVLALL